MNIPHSLLPGRVYSLDGGVVTAVIVSVSFPQLDDPVQREYYNVGWISFNDSRGVRFHFSRLIADAFDNWTMLV